MSTSKNSYWLRSGFYTLFERGAVLVFGFGGVIMLFRTLSLAEFGTWAVFLSIVSILEVGRVGLLSNALVKYLSVAKDADDRRMEGLINTASFVLNGLITVLIVLGLLLLAPLVGRVMEQPILVDMLRIYCVTTILLMPFFQFNFVQQANLDFRGITYSNITKQGTLFAFIAVVFFSGRDVSLTELAYVQVLGAVLAAGVSFSFARRFLVFSKTVSEQWVRKLFRFGKYVCGTNLSTMLYKSIDRLMLGALPGVGMGAVGIYDAAIRVTNMTEVPTFSIASILFPQSAREAASGGKTAVRDLYEKAVGAILAILVPAIVVVLLFAPQIIDLIAGDDYAEAAPVLRLTILFGLFIPFIVQFGTVLDSIGKPKVNFGFTLGSMILNVVLNYVFITRMGVMGAAIGTMITYFCTFCGMQWMLHRELGVKFWRAFTYMIDFYRMLPEILRDRFGSTPTNDTLLDDQLLEPTIEKPATVEGL